MKGIVLIISIFIFVAALPVAERRNTSNAEYYIYHDNEIDESFFERFDSDFAAAREEIAEKFHIKGSLSNSVTLCYGAGFFTAVTGLASDVAGVYVEKENRFVFQRPDALYKKTIVANVIRHELLHNGLCVSRKRTLICAESEDQFFREESFCTALYPAGAYDYNAGKRILSSIGKDQASKYFAINAKSKEIKKRQNAYSLAYAFGVDMLARYSPEKCFELIVNVQPL